MATVDPKKLGNETRSSILPVSTETDSLDTMGPSYDFAGELPLPGNVGVHRGDSLDSVISAVKGAAYYTDMIGFGESSSSMTRGMPLFAMGVNYFTKTGAVCSNGADMWSYINGIPTGEGLGKNVKRAMESAGLPGLRGLAPGMLEDAQGALNPMPIVNTILGSGYARCKQVTMPVGNHAGSLTSATGDTWIRDRGDIDRKSGRPTQTKWVHDAWITQDEYNESLKNRTFCPDGSAINKHQEKDCSKPLSTLEGFHQNSGIPIETPAILLLIGLSVMIGARFI